jgi:hypothetical protein
MYIYIYVYIYISEKSTYVGISEEWKALTEVCATAYLVCVCLAW